MRIARQLRRVGSVLLVAVSLLASNTAFAFDLADEVLSRAYTDVRLTRLWLKCQPGGLGSTLCNTILNVGTASFNPYYPPVVVPGVDFVRSIVPRPNDPDDPMRMTDPTFLVQPIPKLRSRLVINLRDLGFGFNVGATFFGTRTATPNVAKWEGFAAQDRFCVFQDTRTVTGHKVVRIDSLGGNFCATVSQNRDPLPGYDPAKRFYKHLERADDSACNYTTPALAEIDPTHTPRRNFLAVVGAVVPPFNEDEAEFQRQLDAAQTSVRTENGLRRDNPLCVAINQAVTNGCHSAARDVCAACSVSSDPVCMALGERLTDACRTCSGDFDSMVPLCVELKQQASSTCDLCKQLDIPSTVPDFQLSAESCARYVALHHGSGDFTINVTVEGLQADVGRSPVETTQLLPTAGIDLPGRVCREVPPRPPECPGNFCTVSAPTATIGGTVVVWQPARGATTADEEYEVRRLSRPIHLEMRHEPAAGVAITDTAGNSIDHSDASFDIPLADGRSFRLPFLVRLGNVENNAYFTGPVRISANINPPGSDVFRDIQVSVAQPPLLTCPRQEILDHPPQPKAQCFPDYIDAWSHPGQPQSICRQVDLTIDELNCGAFGHDCGGGSCTKGICQPVELASGEGTINGLSASAGSGRDLYFTSWKGEAVVRRVAKAGGAVTTVASDKTALFYGITGDSERIYWARQPAPFTSGPGEILAFGAGVTLGKLATLASSTEILPFAVAVNGPLVYFTNPGLGFVWQVRTSDCSATANQTCGVGAKKLFAGNSGPRHIVADETAVYFTDPAAGKLMKVEKSTGKITVLSGFGLQPWDITLAGDMVAWTDLGKGTGDGSVLAISKSGKTDPLKPTVLATGLYFPWGVASDGKFVYFSSSATQDAVGGTITRVPLAGGERTILSATAAIPEEVAVDGTGVFWSTSDGKIMRLAK